MSMGWLSLEVPNAGPDGYLDLLVPQSFCSSDTRERGKWKTKFFILFQQTANWRGVLCGSEW